jgi:hypothetical protein
MNTMPPATAGEERTTFPVVAVHSGVHTFGEPAQFVVPVASRAYSLWSLEPTKTVLLATAGDDTIAPPVVAENIGVHTTGLPEQPVVPAAL